MVVISYRVVEHYDDGAPEPFGYENLASEPKVGDVLMLHWLDGRDAYQVRVDRVSNMTLHVKAVA